MRTSVLAVLALIALAVAPAAADPGWLIPQVGVINFLITVFTHSPFWGLSLSGLVYYLVFIPANHRNDPWLGDTTTTLFGGLIVLVWLSGWFGALMGVSFNNFMRNIVLADASVSSPRENDARTSGWSLVQILLIPGALSGLWAVSALVGNFDCIPNDVGFCFANPDDAQFFGICTAVASAAFLVASFVLGCTNKRARAGRASSDRRYIKHTLYMFALFLPMWFIVDVSLLHDTSWLWTAICVSIVVLALLYVGFVSYSSGVLRDDDKGAFRSARSAWTWVGAVGISHLVLYYVPICVFAADLDAPLNVRAWTSFWIVLGITLVASFVVYPLLGHVAGVHIAGKPKRVQPGAPQSEVPLVPTSARYART